MVSILLCIISTLVIICCSSSTSSNALKPFTFINHGFISDFQRGEYESTYRVVRSIPQPLALPLGLYFYNDTPNAFTFAIGMGFDYNLRWVWAANRASTVREGATLTFGEDGNLVLADVDHRVVWQTNTTNKGVVGVKLLETGNLVLYDAKRKTVWQSFDYPTDTLLQGQSLRAGTNADKLVSRASRTSSLDGSYRVILRPIRLSMYYKSEFSRHLLQYYNIFIAVPTKEVTFHVDTPNPMISRPYLYCPTENGGAYYQNFIDDEYYNSTSSFLRLDYDGNLRIYAFFDETNMYPWALGAVGRRKVVYTLFIPSGTAPVHETECWLPEYCGQFGLCYKDQCIACPSPDGLRPWTDKCEPPKLVGCSGGKNVEYYKLEGVDYFTSKFTKGEGPMTETECRNKCSFDCKCKGYFYHQESSKCWIAFDLKTLTKSGNKKHLGYIKTAN